MYFPISVENDHLEVFLLNSDFHRTWRNKDSHDIIPQSVFKLQTTEWFCRYRCWTEQVSTIGTYQSCERDLVTCYLFQTVCIFHCYQGATSQLVRITKAPFIIVVTKKPKSSPSFILSFIKSVLFRVWKENFHLHRGEPRLMSRTA